MATPPDVRKGAKKAGPKNAGPKSSSSKNAPPKKSPTSNKPPRKTPSTKASSTAASSTLARRAGRALVALLAGVVVVLAVAAGGLYLHYTSYLERPVLGPDQNRTVVVPHNSSWAQIVGILEDAGLVHRPRYFDLWGRRTGLASTVKAGTFQLQGPLSLDELAEILRRGGMAEEVAVTFPEGFTIFHMAERIEAVGLASREEFLRAARDPDALLEAGIDADSFEGYLFPDTYRFHQGTSARAIVERMHRRFLDVWEDVKRAHPERLAQLANDYSFGEHDVIIMASLVERETNVDDERGLVARVFYNRLDRNMRLQTDPTCVYGEETYNQIPHPRFCRDPLNRYSTYMIDGLTPGPIANPGRESLRAALAPTDTPDAREFLFFVSRRDGTGRHHFTKTYNEHKRAIERFLKR